MRPYHPYTPDQAFLLPASLTELISATDPVHVVRKAVGQLDLSAIHVAYRAERGRPPFHPEAMVGLLLYGACRGIYSSRRLQAACRDNVSFLYLTDWARPDFHTISSSASGSKRRSRACSRRCWSSAGKRGSCGWAMSAWTAPRCARTPRSTRR